MLCWKKLLQLQVSFIQYPIKCAPLSAIENCILSKFFRLSCTNLFRSNKLYLIISNNYWKYIGGYWLVIYQGFLKTLISFIGFCKINESRLTCERRALITLMVSFDEFHFEHTQKKTRIPFARIWECFYLFHHSRIDS